MTTKQLTYWRVVRVDLWGSIHYSSHTYSDVYEAEAVAAEWRSRYPDDYVTVEAL
jgi:hypothetical protein